jgi:putative N-acetyltransferase (TIGR04045 family)
MQWDQPIGFQPNAFVIKPARQPWERRDALALRRTVFCGEQGLFAGDDRDAIDDQAELLVAVAQLAGMPDRVVGTVRIHERTPGTWYGSRLAVERSLRRHGGLGSGLIELAVRTARSGGARVFLAHVQSQNVPLFQRLHWHSLEEVVLQGRPHHFMRADLACYPPLADPEQGLLVVQRQAA